VEETGPLPTTEIYDASITQLFLLFNKDEPKRSSDGERDFIFDQLSDSAFMDA